ncbi:hypothetical protein FHX81_7586 [Saccharothrix saharensis]|uniref:Uncharacterized protein n=1 Tax=Saccharothrix saharensis TaxID=571190 RepID=A0A543JQJ9_9PSEU|nr:hypothetical protein [Saccharothrix saharensis]TQM85116.1 hypothetical protein FHX81_7586 [Saccharothrix saharensis]
MNHPQQPPNGHDPYGQPAPYGGYPYGGFAPQPPPAPKKRTGAIAAAAVVVVLVLGGFAFTGFVRPGFFVDASGTTTTATTTPPTTASSTAARGGDATEVVEAVVAGLDSQDDAALEKLACAKAKSVVDSAIDDVSALRKAKLVDTDEVSGTKVVATVEVTTASKTSEVEVTVVREDGDWCWQDIARADGGKATSGRPSPTTVPPTTGREPTAGGKPVAPEALAAMRSFLDRVNAGDAAGATGLLCADAIADAADVRELVGHEPDLSIDPAMDGRATGDDSVQLYLKGTAKGQKLEGYSTNLWVTGYDGPWCVHAFRAVVI